MHVRTTEEADRDIDEITATIANDSESIALKFSAELWHTLSLLADSPHLGALREDLSVPLRVVRVSRRFRHYLVFYREMSDKLLIVRILHGSRDIPPLLS
jgi:toxin ParE1/3/4